MEGSEASAGRPDRGKQVEHIEVPVPVHVTRSDSHGDRLRMANLSVEEPDALMHARPDLWEHWGVIPSATRPDARRRKGSRAHVRHTEVGCRWLLGGADERQSLR